MKEFMVRIPFDFDKFRKEEFPSSLDGQSMMHYNSLNAFQQNTILDVSGRYAASIALICTRPDLADKSQRAECDTKSAKSVLLQIFDTQDKSSTVFIANVQDGKIPWKDLWPIAHMYMVGTLQQGHIDASNVEVTPIHRGTHFAQAIADIVLEQNSGLSAMQRFKFKHAVEEALDRSQANTEIKRMHEALTTAAKILPKNQQPDFALAEAEMISKLTQPIDVMSWQCSRFSDDLSLEIRESWSGHFAELQAQGFNLNASIALGALKAINELVSIIEGQTQDEPSCTKEDAVCLQFMQANMIRMAERAGCTQQEIAESMDFGIQIRANHYFPKPDSRMGGVLYQCLHEAYPEGKFTYSQARYMTQEIQETIKSHLTGDESISAMTDLVKAMQLAGPEMQIIAQRYGLDDIKLPSVSEMYQKLFKEPSTTWTRYAEAFLVDLPRNYVKEFTDAYQRNITLANVHHDIQQLGVLASQMYKTAVEFENTHEMSPGLQFVLSGIKTTAMEHAAEDGISSETLQDLVARDDIGDDDIGDDAF